MQRVPVSARQDVEHTGEGSTSGREGIIGANAPGGNEERPMAETVHITARGNGEKMEVALQWTE